MNIKDKSFVAIEYTLSLDSGEEVDKSESDSPLGFVFNTGQMISGLENQIAGNEAGFSTNFTVEPEDGYGTPQDDLIRQVSRKNFPDNVELKAGMVFQAEGSQGSIPFRVQSVEDDMVTINLNHPLCGERLHFQLKVVKVRDATEEELAAASKQCADNSCGTRCGNC